MGKYKIKFKILVYGFPPVKENCIFDGYKLKRKKIDENEIFDLANQGDQFNTSLCIMSCTYMLEADKNVYYNYFENEEYINIELNEEEEFYNNKLKQKKIINIILNFEKKLRLQFNMRIIFPIMKVSIYSVDKKTEESIYLYDDFPTKKFVDILDEKKFEHNSHFDFSLDSLAELEKNNVKFKLAMKYFFSSFDPNDVSLRFLMLFSSLESLLIDNERKKKEKLATRVSNLLMYEPCKEKDIYEEIKNLYKLRSNYIHGLKEVKITSIDEDKLRDYTRETLIIYWIYVNNNNLNLKEMMKKLKDKIDFDFQTKIFVKYLRSENYDEVYKEVCNEVASGIISKKIEITSMQDGIIDGVKVIK